MSAFTVGASIVLNHLILGCHVQSLQITRASIQQLSDQILDTVDDIFLSLRIPKNFTQQKHIAERLLIHNFIQNVSERNHKKYREIHNVSKARLDNNKTAYFIFTINEVLEDFITQEGNHSGTIGLRVFDKSNNTKLPVGNGLTVNLTEFNQRVLRFIIKDVVFKLIFANPKPSYEGEEDLKEWVSNMTQLTRRIFRGQSTSVEDFPFMASVHIGGLFSCAGVIVAKDLVISAASCLRAFHTAQTTPHIPTMVRVGSDFANKRGSLVPVSEMFFHPDFNQDSLDNNLVILRLDKRLTFGNKIRRITYDTKAHKLPENVDDILILGWGAKNQKENTKTASNPLSFAYVEVYNLEECKNIYSRFYVKDKHFCTGYASKGSGACNNDIGGPAIIDSQLVGIISFGSPHCGQPDAPTVFTKLGYYSKWINNIVEEGKKKYMRHGPGGKMKSKDIVNELDSLKQLVGEIEAQKHENRSINQVANEFNTKHLNEKYLHRSIESIVESKLQTPIEKNTYNPDLYENQGVEVEYETDLMNETPTHQLNKITPNDKNVQNSVTDIIDIDKLYHELALNRITFSSKTNHSTSQYASKNTKKIKKAEIKLYDDAVDEITIKEQSMPSQKINEIAYTALKNKNIDKSVIEDSYGSNEQVTGRDLFIDIEDDQNNPTMTTRATKPARASTLTTMRPTVQSTRFDYELKMMMTISSESESDNEKMYTSSYPAIIKLPTTKGSGISKTKPSIRMRKLKDPAKSKNKTTQKALRSNVEVKDRGKDNQVVAINKKRPDNKFEIVFWNGGTTKRFLEFPPNRVKLNIRKNIKETMDSSDTAENSDEETEY